MNIRYFSYMHTTFLMIIPRRRCRTVFFLFSLPFPFIFLTERTFRIVSQISYALAGTVSSRGAQPRITYLPSPLIILCSTGFIINVCNYGYLHWHGVSTIIWTCIICVFCACLPVWFLQWHTLCACRHRPASVLLLANEKYLMNSDMFNEESAWDGHGHTQVPKYTMIISIIRNEQFIFSPFLNEHWADVFQSNWQEKETNAFFAFSFSSSSFNFISFMANALCLLFLEKCFIAGYTIGHCLFFIYCIRLFYIIEVFFTLRKIYVL